jgi:hypothetical protein
MVKAGSIDNLALDLERNYRIDQKIDKLKVTHQKNDILASTLSILKEVKETCDLNVALNAEQIMLHQELEKYANAYEEISTIKKGIKQLQEAKQALEIVKDPQKYQVVNTALSEKNRKAGLPLDAMRQFIGSQTTRLSNQMTAISSIPEKNILRQRKENLGMIQEVYKAMQREALGLPQEISKCLER